MLLSCSIGFSAPALVLTMLQPCSISSSAPTVVLTMLLPCSSGSRAPPLVLTMLLSHSNRIQSTNTRPHYALSSLDPTCTCSYTLAQIRNPLAYGVKHVEWDRDRTLVAHRKRLVEDAAQRLDQCGMLKFHKASGNLATTALGRVASFFYIKTESVQVGGGSGASD